MATSTTPETTGPVTSASPSGCVTTDGVDPLPTDPDGLRCSSRGCRNAAAYDLQWNNPKIHTPDRRKHWLACAEHRDSLSRFLSARGFLRDVLDL